MPQSQKPEWLDERIVTALSVQAVAMFGGLSGDVRDENLLMAALARPLNKWHYDDPRPDIYALAAAYCFAIIKGHPFHDGNKRTAYLAAITFLELNEIICTPEQADIIETMLGAAAGTVSEDDLALWFKAKSYGASPIEF